MIHKFSLIYLILIFCSTMLFADSNEWTLVSKMPIPVKGAQAVEHNGLIYILGGYTDSTYASINHIQVYDPANNSWEVLSDTLKIPRYGLSADNYRNSIVMFGSEFTTDSTLEMWDFSGETYFYDARNIFSRQFATCQVLGNYLYIIGGLPGKHGNIQPYLVEYYIPQAQITYYRASSYDENQYPVNEPDIVQQMSAVVGERIYLFGGARNGILNDIYRFETTSHSFTKLNDVLNVSRAAGAAISFESGDIIVVGGYNESSPALSSTEHFKINLFGEIEFSQIIGDLKIPRSELCAVTYQDSLIFVFGGKDLLGNCVEEVEKLQFFHSATALKDSKTRIPSTTELFQNYPNPFNNQTVIRFSIPRREKVILSIYDITGKKISTLLNQSMVAGTHQVRWNGLDAQGKSVASGIYFFRLKAGNTVKTRRLILMR